ncbi:peptidase, M50 family domain protein [Mycobacterium xenopi 3993]|nr:peptidase, M50 family domain protein [Mycobacterium xenopi 3993]
MLLLFLAPALNQWFFGVVDWFFELSGVPAMLARLGSALTRFWGAWF